MCAHLAFTLIFLLHWTEKGINSGILASRLLGGGGGSYLGVNSFTDWKYTLFQNGGQ